MEIRKTRKYPVIVPPRWIKLLIALAYCIWWLWFWIGQAGWSWLWTDALREDFMYFIIFLAGLYLVVYSVLRFGVHYRFTEKYLLVCFIGIPVRWVKWSRITWAQYVHAWRDPKTKFQRFSSPGPVTGNIIYVTIDHCAPWHARYTPRWRHNLSHPFRAFTIWLPYDRKTYFIDAFKAHYPDLEIQPADAWKKFE